MPTRSLAHRFATSLSAAAIAFVSLVSCAVAPAAPSAEQGPPCAGPADCPVPGSSCLVAVCRDGHCGTTPALAGSAVVTQIAGDCLFAACDGEGKVVSRADPADLPADDGNPCTVEICSAKGAEHTPREAGSACGDDEVCSAEGACVACVSGQTRCGAGSLERCAPNGQWVPGAPCSGGCAAGACFPLAEVALGANHACGRFEDGRVACWGDNASEQLGFSSSRVASSRSAPGDRAAPERVATPDALVDLAMGDEHVCALTTKGSVICWGSNDFGQLGDGTNKDRDAPVSPLGIKGNVKQVASGSFHSCALLEDGSALCWGANEAGQLGDGTKPREVSALGGILGMAKIEGPSLVPSLPPAAMIKSDGNLSCALDREGKAWCWGASSGYGAALEKASRQGKARPVKVQVLQGITALALGWFHSCALLGDKSVACWGENDAGQLGDGTTKSRTSPAKVEGLSGVEELASNGFSSCARLGDGSVKCWGGNSTGQLGDGSKTQRSSPVLVKGVSDARRLVLGSGRACAITTQGTVLCWGDSRFGELGAKRSEAVLSPAPLSLENFRP
jgi:alpha-tubulin suppressor-like RCC1 family protein